MSSSLVDRLSGWTGLPSADVERVVRSAPRRYKVFSIAKRSGGFRTIAQPSRELKVLQRSIVDRVLGDLQVHEAAHGYVGKRGIKSNALAHKGAQYVLKMDMENFFPSFRPLDLARYLSRTAPDRFSLEEKRQLYALLFWRPKGSVGLRLCIGAPSSPLVSNVLMYEIDDALFRNAEGLGIVYTRYADDMTFSCSEKGVLPQFQAVVERTVESARTPRLRINREKTVHISRAQRIAVTGIIINTQGRISLGRERKRLIRAMVHRFRLGLLDVDACLRLRGLIAFAKDIEPEFADRMSSSL